MENTMMTKWFETMERNSKTWMDTMVKNQNFVKNFLKTYEPIMDASKNMDDMKEKTYESMGLMTKKDLVKITQKLQDIETKVADLDEKLDTFTAMQNETLNSLNEIKGAMFNN